MIQKLANTFELNAESGPAKGQKIPFALRVCPNPSCGCRSLTIILEERMTIPSTGIQAAPRAEFSIDLNTADLYEGEEMSAAAIERMENFYDSLSDDDFAELQGVFHGQKQSVIYHGPLSEVDKDWHARLDISYLVPIREIFPLVDHLKFEHEGVLYWIEDSYCLAAGCDCRVALLTFARETKDSKDPKVTKLVTECTGRCHLVDGSFKVERLGNFPIARRLFTALQAHIPGVLDLLGKRYARVRQLVAEQPPRQPIDTAQPAAQPVITTPKPGRNDPCPCGSGKKYKRCCGA